MGRHDIAFEASKALEALDILKSQLGFLNEADDPVSVLISVESETNVIELLDRCVIADAEMKADIDKNDELSALYSDRSKALKKKRAHLNALFELVLERMDLKSVPGPFGTIIRRKNPENIEILEEAAIPPEFWKTETISSINRVVLKDTFLKTMKIREEMIDRASVPFAVDIAKASAMPDGDERDAAFTAIKDKLAPAMVEIDEKYPLPPGVALAPSSFSSFVKR